MTKDEAKERIAKLVADYQALSLAQAKSYHEAKTKQGFVQPLFRCLGWDFDNVAEVAPEEKASNGRVDYAFKLKGVSRFYLEAKPLKADLNNPDYIKQAVTYAYNKGVTWAGLTSFDRLRLFNAQTGHPFLNLVCQNYVADFDRLWLLSRESVESGALDSEAAKVGALKPAQPIESRLFDQLREWRQELFSQLHSYNTKLTFSQIDEVIQRLFNRLIFIRTCEDRRIEEKTLLAAVNRWEARHKPDLIVSLKDVFKEFDLYYDSDLFTEHPLDHAFIESDTLVRVIRGLYEVPGGQAGYDFSVIDADVLGAVYEQYLGHVAKAVKQRVKEAQAYLDLGFVDEDISLDAKRQKRKQQGIFYTPRWVTDYIVKHTVGCFIDEHSHDDVVSIKVLDLACGSGSFLIRAYDELLNYHARVRGKPISGLDQWERLTVLTGNIFGVDLDGQAVEIARLNLLLRSLARREILPSLADNVRRGNSLISGGEAELKPFFGASWNDKRAFDWKQEFAAVMNKGGFDIIVGNPPYIRIQTLPRPEAEYFRANYEGASGSFDIYVLFIEKAIRLLKTGGQLGFITSGKFLKSDYGKKIQQVIHEQCTVEDVIDLSAQQVFAEATTYPVIMILRKGAEKKPLNYIFVTTASAQPPDIAAMPAVTAGQDAVIKGVWPLSATDDKLLTKLAQKAKPLGEIAERIFQGLVTSADKIYILEKRGEAENSKIRGYSHSLAKEVELESALLKPLLMGNDIERYRYPAPVQLLLFPYKVTDDQAELITPQEFASSYPLCWQYLLDNRRALENREKDKMKHENWYAYVYPKSLTLHDKPKLLTGVLANKSRFTIDKQGIFYFMGGGNAGGYGITLKSATKENCLYVLGLLNSTLLDFNLKKISSPFRGGFFSYARRYIERLPIRRIDFSSPSDKKMHDDLVVLVEKMLGLNSQLQQTPPEHVEARHDVERQIHHTDESIDSLVFELYGLSQAERDAMAME